MEFSEGGYREALYEALVEHSQAVLMIGPNDIYPSDPLISAGQQFHAGFGCFNIAQIDANLDGNAPLPFPAPSNCGGFWITGIPGVRPSLSPDVILLMAGTNDMNGFVEINSVIDQLDHLFIKLYTLCPQTHLIVAKIPPMFMPIVSKIELFNTEIERLVHQYSLSGYRISLVDQYTPFLSSYFIDGLHPNDKPMYRVMAEQWLPKVLEAIHLKELQKISTCCKRNS